MESFWTQGVVRNGQVVLTTPLNLPDGTLVTVMNYDPDENPSPREPVEPWDPTVAQSAFLTWVGKPELSDDPSQRLTLGSICE